VIIGLIKPSDAATQEPIKAMKEKMDIFLIIVGGIRNEEDLRHL
jgi:hypothetical protein